MSRTWFTSDLHLGHENIIRYCNRPFESARQMDAAIIANWNAVVRPDDDVYVVGDFVHGGDRSAQSYLSELLGRKHLIPGNHDKNNTRTASGWTSVNEYLEISVDKTFVVLCHYGLRTWRRIARGSLMLHGHSHGRLPGFATPSGGGTVDVGVDCWNYQLTNVSQILKRLKGLKPAGAFGQEEGERGEDE